MNRVRSILLCGLVALMMVGMVYAGEASVVDSDSVERSYIGTWTAGSCIDTQEWKCLHLEITFAFDIPISI